MLLYFSVITDSLAKDLQIISDWLLLGFTGQEQLKAQG